jgi:hypothetical protein
MTNEGKYPLDLKNTKHETNTFNKYQGDFRIAVLDLDQLVHAKREGIDKVVPEGTRVNLVITCMDQLNKYKVSVGDQLLSFYLAAGFANHIGKTLKINGSVFMNNSPFSTTLRHWRTGYALGA